MGDQDVAALRGTLSIKSNPQYDYTVFIGRFRPFHNGHLAVVKRAIALGRHAIVMVGSCGQARSHRNPFVFREVEAFIRGSLSVEENLRLTVVPLMDRYNDVAWTRDVLVAARNVILQRQQEPRAAKVCLIGHHKDQSSDYLDLFPQWAKEGVADTTKLSATPIRDDYFADAKAAIATWSEAVPACVGGFMESFAATSDYARLVEEAEAVRAHKALWKDAPYEPTFTSADAVVLCAGHLLVVPRNPRSKAPITGRGLLSLPGRIVGKHERILDAVLKDLREEIRIKVPTNVLSGSVLATEIFDSPYRDPRGRFISHSFLIQLSDTELPKVRDNGPLWMPLDEVEASPDRFWNDNWHIAQTMQEYCRERRLLTRVC
jgi:bifunctional NMN adenylyltransferase/nudix hydrolase